jgi:hypothetical protein
MHGHNQPYWHAKKHKVDFLIQTKQTTNMTIEKTIQGAWRISDIIGGHLEVKQYFGYSKSEAIRAFIAEHGKGEA